MEKLDEWLPGVQAQKGSDPTVWGNEFFDTRFLAAYEFEIDTSPLLAEIYFRLDAD